MTSEIIVVDRLELTVDGGPLGWAEENRAVVSDHWREAISARPGLYNGAFFLFEQVGVAGGVFRAVGRRADYATFLHWRDSGCPDLGFRHLFPVGALITADRHLLLGEMSGGTANAGRFYPPSGSFDPNDLVGERLDPLANIVRELGEEIGLDLPRSVGAGGAWLVVPDRPNCFALVTPLAVGLSAADLVAHAGAHLAAQKAPELARVIAVPIDAPPPDLNFAPYVRRLMGALAP